MGLELGDVLTRIDTPAEARSHAKRWNRMASEIDTPDAPEEAKEKARELRQRASAAYSWARKEEAALDTAKETHDAELANEHNVVPIRPEAEEGGESPAPAATSSRARRAGAAAYKRSRPPAMRLAVRGKQHFFKGAGAPFTSAGSGWDLLFESLGLTLAVVVIADVLGAPSILGGVGPHISGGIHRAVAVEDPLTKRSASAAPRPAAARPATHHAVV